jgi:hypothetical protein
VSGVGLATVGDLAESNYLTIVGLHLLVGDLPANPTTWFVGTYLHMLLVWALLLRGRRFTGRHWRMFFALDIVIRAALVLAAGPHRAYMAIFNWLDLFVLGLVAGADAVARPRWLAAAVAIPLLWPLMLNTLPWQSTFPFMTLTGESAVTGAVALSVAVSLGYTGYTWAAWSLARLLPAPAWIRLLARNTTLVFVAHMPVYFLLEYLLQPRVPDYWLRVLIEWTICLPVLALVSEWLHRWPTLDAIKQLTARRLGWVGDTAPPLNHAAARTAPR